MLSDYLPSVKIPDITKGCRVACIYSKGENDEILVCTNKNVSTPGRQVKCVDARSNSGACGPEARHMAYRE